MDTDVGPDPDVLFRPVKRRKFQRRRPDDTDSQQETQASNDASETQGLQGGTHSLQTADALRIRRLHRSRKGGIEFSTTSRPTTEQGDRASLSTETAEDIEDERLRAMCDRFTAHTGQTVDVDKHMMAYIESELAKRYRHGMPGDAYGPDIAGPRKVDNTPSTTELPEREPASLGKLHEIDLGRETKLRNIARTEEATRKLKGEDGEISTERASNVPSRYWKRTSEDIERDRLVEEVLRESKMDVYDEPEEEEAAVDDQAADDRVAEQFRREFLDAIQSRRRVARMKTATKQPGKAEAPKGPKLGGSRSARAAMREMQEKSIRK